MANVWDQREQCRNAEYWHGYDAKMLMPCWDRQWNRLRVPCVHYWEGHPYMWFRTGKVVTLGELFLRLGHMFTASSIYAFYRTLLLVVTKRRKQHSYRNGWKTHNPLTAHRVKRSLITDMTQREYLVQEYSAAWKLGKLPVTKETVDAAVRQVYKFLLCDLNPPGWTTNSPRLCQGKACCLVSRDLLF